MLRFLLLLALLPATAFGQGGVTSWPVAYPGEFENPPLLYKGPDPTVEPFLPAIPGHVSSSPLAPLPAPNDLIAEGTLPDAGLPPAWMNELPVTPNQGVAVYEPISEFKDGFFQKLDVSAGWIDRGKASGFGVTEIDLYGRFAVPAPTTEWPLVLQPTFNVQYLDGPTSPHLPPRLYETFLEFIWLPRVSPRWLGILSVAPSYYGDFVVDEDEAWRLTGKGLARFDWVPERLQLLFGVLYLSREDYNLLPAGGLIWTPSETRRYELIFPEPKLAHRIERGPGFEDWIYLGAEFGGNSWAYEADTGVDIVTLLDYRIIFGLERKRSGGAGRRIEIGYVFSRTAEFRSGIPEVRAPNTAFLRAGLSF
ncbi:MAG: hypothetical protein ACC628_15445 [Pirellulaceae bacterium]